MNQIKSNIFKAFGWTLLFAVTEVAAVCVPAVNGAGGSVISPIIAGTNNLTLGNGNNQVNGTTMSGTGITSVGAPGVRSNAGAGALPALSPAIFPKWNSTITPAVPVAAGTTTILNNGPVSAGAYETLNVSGNPTTFTGGTYYINKLNVTGSIELGPGTYYINTMNLNGQGKTTPNVTVTGAVQIYIGNALKVNGSNGASFNDGGNVGNLQVNLYAGSEFEAEKNNINFTGLIYAPYSSAQVKLDGNNTTITGAVVSAGQVKFGNNTEVIFGATQQSQISGLNCGMGPTVDHFLISHPSTGLTCSPAAVNVSACADAACTTFTGGISVTLQPGGAVVTTSAAGAVASTVAQNTAGTATLTATSATAPAAATQCANSTTGAAASTAACANAMTFNTAGFVITAPNHVSCADTAVTIEAVQQGVVANRCIPAYASVTRAVNLNIAYANPTAGTKTLTDVTNNSAITTAASAHNLTFDATGKATLSISYPDVGQVSLTASDTAPTGAAMTGSRTFIAAPATFAISAPIGQIKAGNNFAATVTAKTTTGTACAVATAAPNFGKEAPAEGVTLSFSKCQPTGVNSSPGSFSGGVGAFANGVASASNLNWSEVGNGDLVAILTSGSYLGSALTATGNTGTAGVACTGAGKVGPFIPDHFTTSIIDGCLGCGFTYSGQPFTVTITAMNGLATPTKTVNYDGTVNTSPTFANNVTLTDANAVVTPVGKLGVSATAMGVTANAAGTTLTVPKADFTKGVATLANVPTYTFNAVTTAPTMIKIHAVDAVNATVTSAAVEGATEIRSGRIKVGNAYGSEKLPLTVPVTIQYWDGAKWVLSSTDGVTQINTNLTAAGGSLVAGIVGGLGSGVSVSGAGLKTVAGGQLQNFVLGSFNQQGVADLSFNAPSWLAQQAGQVTFGIYKGGKEFIYLREAY